MDWASRWGMQFNTGKCKVMHVGRHNPAYTYEMGGQKLETTATEKDIGVIVNSDLKPSDQCAKAARTASTVLGQITRSFHYRDRWTFVNLYKLYVRPHLEFATPAWRPWAKGDVDALEKVQIRAVNMISGMGELTYEQRLQELHMDTLEDRRKDSDMFETFKIMKGISKVNRATWFTCAAEESGRLTRLTADPLNLRVPATRLEIRKNFFSVRVCEQWNTLPSEVKRCENLGQFKTAYKKHKNDCARATEPARAT